MMLKDILVHLDQTPASSNRVQAAILLARQHGACVRGLFIYTAPQMRDPASAMAQLRAAFERQVADAGVASVWVDVDLGFSKITLVEMLAYHSCFSDLLVVTPGKFGKSSAQHSIARLLVGAGCPVLLVPAAGTLTKLGERIMVAWKAGPKASRALRDAWPLLARAQRVSLVSVGENPGFSREGEQLNTYLASHQLQAKVERVPRNNLHIGDALLNLAVDHAIDLLVVGVHVTARRGHLELGEVGNRMIEQINVPMLMTS